MKWIEFLDTMGRGVSLKLSSIDGILEIETGLIQIYVGTHFINVCCKYDIAQNLIFGSQEKE